jgi:hypothetical protein
LPCDPGRYLLQDGDVEAGARAGQEAGHVVLAVLLLEQLPQFALLLAAPLDLPQGQAVLANEADLFGCERRHTHILRGISA